MLGAIFRQEHPGRGELVRRVRILRMAGRGTGRNFNLIADALTRRRQLYIAYRSRSYDDPRELIRDILKHGPDVEVLALAALRSDVAARLEAAARGYGTSK